MLPHLEGQVIGGCRLLRRLGAGGMGEVYLAEQVHVGGRLVAIKLIHPGDDTPQEFQGAAQRFLREGRLLGRFAHPHILPVHESGIDGEYLYLVMKYAPDGSLNDAIRGRGPHPLALPLPIALTADIIHQLAAALQYTHDRGIVHGDVKPGNVLVETAPDGHRRLLLADFGVARELEATAQWSIVAGTVAYMAPEQFSGQFSPASDQYALAVVAYQLLTGRTPFEGGFAAQMRGHLDSTPPRLRGLNPDVPPQLEAAICRALAKHPRRRFPSVLAFGATLEAVVHHEGEATVLSTPGMWEATSKTRPRVDMALEAREHPATWTYRPPSLAWDVGSTRAPSAASRSGTVLRPGQRHLALFSICAALLLLAVVASRGGARLDTSNALAPHKVEAAATVPVPGTPGAPPTPAVVATPVPTLTPLHLGTVASGNSFVATVSAPAAVAPGRRFTASVLLRNTGSTTWSRAAGYRLTCDTVRVYQPPPRCTRDFVVSLGHYLIPPGTAITFQLRLTAPMTLGIFSAWVTMAQGTTLFSTAAVHIQVAVRHPAPPPTPTTAPQPTATPQPSPTSTPEPSPTSTPSPSPSTTATGTATVVPTETASSPLAAPEPTATDD
jgi:serine/threonine protein kinase